MSPYLNQVSLMFHGLVLAATTKKTSSSSTTLLLLVGFGLLLYLFVLRPRSQRMRKMQQQNREANVGDEVMLASGIIGRVTGIEGDRATLEIAPEIEIEIVRRAISTVLTKADDELSLDVPPDPGSDDYLSEHGSDGDDEYDDSDDDQYDDDADEDTAAAETDADTARADTSSTPGLPGPGAALDLGREGHTHS